MKKDGKADSALEQLLWAFAMGRVYNRAERRFVLDDVEPVTMAEANAMFRATCGVTPSRDELAKWLKSLNQFLLTLPGASRGMLDSSGPP